MSKLFLEVEESGEKRKLELGTDAVTIGRHATCQIVITDGRSSRNHCVVEKVGGAYQVKDLASRNGTALNGEMLATAVKLKNGDVIQIGGAKIRFVDPLGVASAEAHEDVEVLSDSDIFELTEEDLVDEDDGDPFNAPIRQKPTERAVPLQKLSDDPEEAMESLVESLPDCGVFEKDILMLNARGQMSHAAPKAIPKKGKREAIDIFRLLILLCIRSRTTDIHVEPHQDNYQIRVRVDGNMVEVARFPSPVGLKMTTLVKVMSDIDIAQRNSIQEGRFSAMVPSKRGEPGHKRRIDYRVSFAPAMHGQKLVIRILDEENAPVKLADMDLPKWMLKELGDQVKQDAGMVLVTGPTGSGKTTTLYSLLRSIDLSQRNAVTIEDPVEMQIDGTTQIPVDEAGGKSFGQILRSVLRQDPDIIMLGEIRDAETARTAMQAAITGHMVLSTLHTRDTLGTVFRLLDLGVEPYLVSQGLNIVIAQRLVRQLCSNCRMKVPASPEQREALKRAGCDSPHVYVPRGCLKCLGTGHMGRRAVFELLRVNETMKELIISNPSTQKFEETLQGTSFTTLAESGYRLAAQGVASFEEVERMADKDSRGKGKGM